MTGRQNVRKEKMYLRYIFWSISLLCVNRTIVVSKVPVFAARRIGVSAWAQNLS